MTTTNGSPWHGQRPPKMEKWTPTKCKAAILFLEEHPEKQRRRSKDHIKALARDIENGNFVRCYAPIVISEDGFVIDGQHRFAAIVKAERPVWMWTFRDVPYKDIFHVDLGGVARRAYVQANLVQRFDRALTSNDIALTMYFLNNPYTPAPGRITENEKLDAFGKHREAIEFSNGVFGGTQRGLTTSPVRGCIAVAYEWGADPDALTTFVSVLLAGAYDSNVPAQKNVTLLRRFLLDNSSGTSASHAGRATTYKRTVRALSAFLNGDVLTRLFEAGTDPFPLLQEAE